ncbi:MAG: thioredoxin [Christensenellales bacterium]|jgi:thioredoxin 1
MAAMHLTSSNFDQEVLNSTIPVFVDLWAPWCGPCRMVGPIVEQIADEYEGRIKVGKVNVDEEPELARRYGVMSIPTLLIIKDGKVVAKQVGAMPKPKLAAMIDEVL